MPPIKNPPGPKEPPLAGSLLRLLRDPLNFLTSLERNYGEIAYFRRGRWRVYLISNPEYIKDVLVTNHKDFMKGRGLQRAKRLLGNGLLTSEGEFWRRQRRLAQPAFHKKRVASYAGVMAEYAQRMSESWQDGATYNISQEMMRLTLAIVGKTLFDADVEKEAEEIGQALTTVLELFEKFALLPFSEVLERLPIKSTRMFQQARARLDSTVYRMINERRVSGEDRGDLLSMLLLAQDEEGDGSGMTDEQLRDEAMTLFLAGHETTANALTWTWYLLSQNPEAEAKLHAELDAVLGGRLPTYDDLPKLKYTEMVLAEAMRLYPPAYTVGRRALKDYQVGGYIIPKDSTVIMSQYVMHRHPRYFSDPEKFDPERWTPENRARLPKFVYFPFGGGPRICIGESFALMEAQLVLATLAQRWSLQLLPGHPVALRPMVTLRPRYGMKMILSRRQPATAAPKELEASV